ncbi:MAG: hypothetical protein Q8O41_05615, partial [Candidatus Methanoperedens sp.]|nr:hypothetical protein [Candidatus Methanoperedens sp.]
SMYAEAIQCYDKLLEINPLDAAAWCIKGDVQALRAYDKSIEINPAVTMNNKGNALYKKGDIRETLKSYQMAFELAPDSSAAPLLKEIRQCKEKDTKT